MAIKYDYEAIVIGSGFGGSINTCRLAKKWPGKVMLLERGKRYPMGSFPRKPHDMANNFWNIVREGRNRPKNIGSTDSHGMFDIRLFDHIDALVCAGLGGGSLIYANVFLQPPDAVFDENWPETCKKEVLQPYYQAAKSVLGARPIPQNDDPRRQIIRTELFNDFAKHDGHDSELVDINVFFGNDFEKPLDIGVQEKNRYGAIQTSCVYCAECDVGCNTHSKNTVDLNYLFVAENEHKAQIQTEVLAEKIVPLNEQGAEDPAATGDYGYKVFWLDLNNAKTECSAITQRVVVSAGTLGSNELLMRCRDIYKTLPDINDNLGKHFSGNGDFLSFVIEGEKPADPNYGPVITQKTDYNLFKNFDKERAFVLEDASYPNFAAWYVEGIKPGLSHFNAFVRTAKLFTARFLQGITTGPIGYAFNELLKGDASFNSVVLLCMGLDKSNGTIKLGDKGFINIDWPYKDSMSLYQAILDVGKRFKEWTGGKVFIPLPNWLWPMKSNITVHSLGGCRLADSPENGVTSANVETFGQVFGYTGLYVADGALLPTAVGANPVATISALSERVAEGITGISPDTGGKLS
ncbi:cholesterol oxidase [Methyloprofundus sedimenti]|uniref:Cholesterol oxidase n=1 Tax=Methyloprofundus sedimenti TaxID=1420851 RepID=A0A1V8M830_9GAMM|nr:GMC oxidoreductase [Methyloprofundus sedimenti]OQK17689.1 cholesterol oxidase [Methyloprofundus sedimenti]